MGGAVMPQPPQNWPPNEGQAIRSGKSRNDSHETENFLAIGPDATRLSSKLGVIARNDILAPLNHKDWRLVPKLKNTDATEDMRRMLMISVGSKWKEWKHEAKMIGYEPYNNDIERLAKRPDRVEEDQWRKEQEEQRKLSMPHTSERKSHSQIIDDMTKKNGVKPSRIEVFKETHTRKNKQPVNEIADETMKEMDEHAKVYPELNSLEVLPMMSGYGTRHSWKCSNFRKRSSSKFCLWPCI
uniref:Uncharacterized protein LOC104241144 n=1 Tax=Nicotiana sylvestris TaxID=4096 RepID=A0A1U7Y6E6_NICSY|nr:PREDICTED: uncharacterized protein LOC104241144 [Nicotiana sylvestris]